MQCNWLLGYRIAQEELKGEGRSEYGTAVIRKLAKELEEELRAEIETQKEMFYLQHNQNKDICGENTKMTKIEKAQESCEQVLNGIEDGTITTTSALLVILYARPFSREEKVTWKY